MKKLTICRIATILCGLLTIAIYSMPDMTTGHLPNSKLIGVALGLLSAIFGTQWVGYQKRQDVFLTQPGSPNRIGRLLDSNVLRSILDPFSVVKRVTSGTQKRSRSVVGKPILVSCGWVVGLLLSGLGSPARGQCFTLYNSPYAVSAKDVYGATDVAMGDFNQDGRPDMAIVRSSQHLLSVVYGQAFGGFSAPVDIKVGNSPNAVVVGDFNSDGKPDLAVVNEGSKDVRVLLNNGLVGFSLLLSVATPLGFAPLSLAVSDLNGDGRADLVITNPADDQVVTLLGTDTGDFLPPNAYAVGDSPWSVAMGDFNGDGKPDMVVTNYGLGNSTTGSVSMLMNKGILGFYPATTFYVGATPEGIAVGDFNEDGKLDLAVTNRSPGNVVVCLNNGVGTFISYTNYPVGYQPSRVAVGDLNNDGKLDLVVSNYSSHSISRLLNTGGGSFGLATNYSTGVSSAPCDVAISDINSDGKLDIVVAEQSSTWVHVMLQHICPNTGPFKVTYMPTLQAFLGQPFSYTIPDGYFSDAETPDKLTYLITNLPAGLVFTAPATISGTPSGKTGQFSAWIKVYDPQTLILNAPLMTNVNFLISNAANNQAPTVNKVLPDQIATLDQPFICLIPDITFTDAQTPNDLTLAVTGLPAGLVFTAPNTIRGTPSTLRDSPFQVTVTATNLRELSVSTTFMLVVQAQPLLLIAPLYNCQTGAFTFQTTGGDGSRIEYMSLNNTGWTSNPNQIIDRVLRAAAMANPLTLKARQRGQEVVYSWDIRIACPAGARSRLAAETSEPEVVLQAEIYPNPVEEDFTVAIDGASGQAVRLWLVDGQGRTIEDRQIRVDESQHKESMSLDQREPGLYLLRVSTTGQTKTLKVLKQ